MRTWVVPAAVGGAVALAVSIGVWALASKSLKAQLEQGGRDLQLQMEQTYLPRIRREVEQTVRAAIASQVAGALASVQRTLRL
jgi:hypothetical protein